MLKPTPESGQTCPFLGKDVSKACPKCPLFILIRGKHPQTGADVDEWGCSHALLPMLLIENARQSRATAAATEDLRNEVVKQQPPNISTLLNLLMSPSQQPKLISPE